MKLKLVQSSWILMWITMHIKVLHPCMFSGLCFVSEPSFIFMYRISRYSWGEQGICFGNLRIAPLLLWMMWFCWFNQSVTFSMHWSGLQLSEKQVGWETGGMRISASKSKAMVLCQKNSGTMGRKAASSKRIQSSWDVIHKWWEGGARDGLAHWCSIRSNEDILLDCWSRISVSTSQPSPTVMKSR